MTFAGFANAGDDDSVSISAELLKDEEYFGTLNILSFMEDDKLVMLGDRLYSSYCFMHDRDGGATSFAPTSKHASTAEIAMSVAQSNGSSISIVVEVSELNAEDNRLNRSAENSVKGCGRVDQEELIKHTGMIVVELKRNDKERHISLGGGYEVNVRVSGPKL